VSKIRLGDNQFSKIFQHNEQNEIDNKNYGDISLYLTYVAAVSCENNSSKTEKLK